MTGQGYFKHLVVMAKRPGLGTVKSRLAAGIGNVEAAYFYRHMLNATLARLGRDRRWRCWLALTPDHAVVSHVWPGHITITGQGKGDLGHRMDRLSRRLPRGPVIFIGSDIPDIAARDIAQAFDVLKRVDVVIGPSPDGGYWLIGQRRSPRVHALFHNVRWSSADTLNDTLANIGHLKLAWLEARADIDDVADYAAARKARGLNPFAL